MKNSETLNQGSIVLNHLRKPNTEKMPSSCITRSKVTFGSTQILAFLPPQLAQKLINKQQNSLDKNGKKFNNPKTKNIKLYGRKNVSFGINKNALYRTANINILA
ncbi:hypothetical protein ABPG72_018849 [Tetrahymena utriculariae]